MNATVANPDKTGTYIKESRQARTLRKEALAVPVVFNTREEANDARDRVQAEDFFALERILKPATL